MEETQITPRSGTRVNREVRTPDANPVKGGTIFRLVRKGRVSPFICERGTMSQRTKAK